MSSNIKEHVQQLDTALSKQKDAWAAWRDAATKARFAAVMGSAMSRNLRESSTWTIKESLDSNDDYTSALQAVRSEHQREALQTATQQHEQTETWPSELAANAKNCQVFGFS